ncbi:hypothetical protein [Candidatus Magnetobacterium casense]|uniref:Uncharacterized protein n=1 Tax=Candidatus Magnetobacterium casense TaxID=1455061 RepID=A0ABS6S3Y2_9BACT|nr:hypothetical protein [Candidatus Magnetobacterium casensis]MBV6343074.1 hypothetical protein [Candidatus Magnetobacterium casensis]
MADVIQQRSDKALEYVLNPPVDRMYEFTVIPKGSSWLLAHQLAKFHMFDPGIHKYDENGRLLRRVTIAELAYNFYFKLQRSVDGNLLKGALDLSSLELGADDGVQDRWDQ